MFSSTFTFQVWYPLQESDGATVPQAGLSEEEKASYTGPLGAAHQAGEGQHPRAA